MDRTDDAPAPFDVVSFGEGGGFGTIDADGRLDARVFPTRKAAEAHAEAARSRDEHAQAAPAPPGTPGRPASGARGSRPAPTPAPTPSRQAAPAPASRRSPAPAPIDLADPPPRPAAAAAPASASPLPPDLLDAIYELRAAVKQIPGGLGQAVRGIGAAVARAAVGKGLGPVPGVPGGPPIPGLSSRAASGLGGGSASSPGPLAGLGIGLPRGALGQLSAGFAAAVADLRARFGKATSGLADSFEKAFDASIGRVIGAAARGASASARFAGASKVAAIGGVKGLARGAVAAWANPRGTASAGLQGIKDFAWDFRHAFQHAGRGIPLGGIGGQIGNFLGRGSKGIGRGFRGGWRGAGAFAGGARRVARSFRKGLGKFAGRAGMRFRSGMMAARHHLSATGGLRGVGKAFASGSGIGGFGLGELGAIVQAATVFDTAARAAGQFAERINASNRALAPYSGKLQGAFARLSIADEFRTLRLAKATEGTGSRLADSVNVMRESNVGVSTLSTGLSNRAGIALSSLVTPFMSEVSNIAGGINGWMDRKDPAGANTKGFFDGLHEEAAFKVAYAQSLITPGKAFDFAEANKAGLEAARQVKMEREARERKAIAIQDGWTQWMAGAMQLGPLNPPRGQFKP